MTRFYIEYLPDCGFGAISCAHQVITAHDFKDAMATWPSKVNGHAAYKRLPPEACFELPAFMHDWPADQVLAHYRNISFDGQFVAPEDMGFGHRIGKWLRKHLLRRLPRG